MEYNENEANIIWSYVKQELKQFHNMKVPRRKCFMLRSIEKTENGKKYNVLKVGYFGSKHFVRFPDYTFEKCQLLLAEYRQRQIDFILY